MNEKCQHGILLTNHCTQCHDEIASHVGDTLIEREHTYGKYREQCVITDNIKRALYDSANWEVLTPDKKESLSMIAVKMGRILNGDPEHHDSWHDIEGYAKLVADTLESSDKSTFYCNTCEKKTHHQLKNISVDTQGFVCDNCGYAMMPGVKSYKYKSPTVKPPKMKWRKLHECERNKNGYP